MLKKKKSVTDHINCNENFVTNLKRMHNATPFNQPHVYVHAHGVKHGCISNFVLGAHFIEWSNWHKPRKCVTGWKFKELKETLLFIRRSSFLTGITLQNVTPKYIIFILHFGVWYWATWKHSSHLQSMCTLFYSFLSPVWLRLTPLRMSLIFRLQYSITVPHLSLGVWDSVSR